jgi:glycerophosphoryl diester phosphodiesterase
MSKVYAHRGASAERPENTLPAFARALELGADGIELDVHLSRDGVPVVIHDDTVNRTTNGEGAVAEMAAADLQALDAGGGAGVPTLANVLDLVDDRMHVDIEVKVAAAADAVLAETIQRPTLSFAISSFNHDVLRHVRAVHPRVELWPLTLGVADDVLATANALGSPCIAVHDPLLNAEIVEYARGRGVECWVWTVNDPERAVMLAQMGAIGICTDNPAAMLERIRDRGAL